MYDASEKYYKLAAELRPMLPWPNNSLGLLYLRLGREKEAREVLDKAFKVDEFNVRVSNSLKVLRHLEKYETLQTEHFELRFDPLRDKRLAHLMAKYMESIYADLGEKFEYRPEGRILVELFNNHEMFSGRTVALPDLHTIAACTGRVMAMVSPSGEGMRKPFNWVRVLRHELVHIFNLEQTRFQLPHWFTEGLAVINEGFPRPQPWNQMLRQRVPAGDIMNLDNIDLGFIRPKSPADWHMAYCQSQLYVEFMKSKYGAHTIGGMLAAYRDGLDTAAAIVKVCKVDKKVFEEGYRAYLDEVVKSLHGRPTEKALSFSQLQRLHETEPENLDAAARLSEQYLIRKMKKEARQLVEAVLAKQERQPVACYVKARLLMEGGQDEEAQKLLEVALDRENPEPKIVQALGKLYFEFKDFGKAAEVYELAHKSEPYESRWLVELVRVYTQAGDTAKRIDTLIKLVPTDADDIDTRKRLAQLLLDAKRYAEAERYARESLEIDVRDGESQETLDKALRGQNKTKEADEMRKLLGY